MHDCEFCKIVSGEYKNSNIYEDDSLLSFMDIQPVNKGHILVIPKKHVELISDLDEQISGKMFILAGKINKALRRSGIRLEGVNYFLADGEAAGQEVPHTHLHIIPRFRNDGFGLKFPVGYRVDLPERNELDNLAESIKENLEI